MSLSSVIGGWHIHTSKSPGSQQEAPIRHQGVTWQAFENRNIQDLINFISGTSPLLPFVPPMIGWDNFLQLLLCLKLITCTREPPKRLLDIIFCFEWKFHRAFDKNHSHIWLTSANRTDYTAFVICDFIQAINTFNIVTQIIENGKLNKLES